MPFATPIKSSIAGLSPKPESCARTGNPNERKKLMPFEPIKPNSTLTPLSFHCFDFCHHGFKQVNVQTATHSAVSRDH